MHSIRTLSSGEGSLEAFSIRYCTACFASLSQTGFLLALLSLGTICLLYYLSRPLNLIYDLTGAKGDKYFKLPAKNEAMAIEHLKGRLQRKSGKSIPVYPNGWFGILESSEIGRNEVKYVMALVPDLAEVQTLRSAEVNHIIFLWYHAEREEPSYEIQPLKETTSEGYLYIGRFECLIDAHIEDMLQNSADNEHLGVLHASKMGLVGADLDGFCGVNGFRS
nr:PREDICTED: cholesterol 7-desaturase-like isoform X3 [Bemisia tabaci]